MCAAAVLTVGLNVVLTPMLPRGSFAELAASQPFLLRQALASLAALSMLFGVVGLHVARLGTVRAFGTVAFVVAISGAVSLFATEWNQLFTIRDLALHQPQALISMEDADGLTPFDVGSLASAATFFLGWLLMAISLLLSKNAPRIGGAIVLVGFVVAPVLSAVGINGPMAVVGASSVVGAGWFVLGLHLMRGRFRQVGA